MLALLLCGAGALMIDSDARIAAQTTTTHISLIPITEGGGSAGAYVRGLSRDGKRILFESANDYTGENRDGNNEIFIYDADLQRIIQITRTGVETFSGPESGGATPGRASPSARNCPGGCGPSEIRVTNTVPVLSGDGNYIAFCSNSGLLAPVPNPDGNYEIYLAHLPRGSLSPTFTRITETDGAKDRFDNNTPSISDDGSRIAFISTRRLFKAQGAVSFSGINDDGIAQLFVYDVRERRFTQATHKRVIEGMKGFEARGFISSPSISGDGEKVAFLSGFNFHGSEEVNNSDLNGEIFVYRVGDPINQVTQITDTEETAEVPDEGAINVLARFSRHLSADGRWLVFESAGGRRPAKTGERIRDVFVCDLETMSFRQVTTQDVGRRDLSDFNYFPSINAAGTEVVFSSKLNLPVVNDPGVGNFNNSREVYGYDLAGSTPSEPRLTLMTETEVEGETDERQLVIAPFVSDDGRRIAFSHRGDLVAERASATTEVFQSIIRPITRESGSPVSLANAASLDRTAIARGSIVLADGAELSGSVAESTDTDNFPFELDGVSVTIGDGISGVAARVIAVAPHRVRFVMPVGIEPRDDVSFLINNNGIISRGTVDVRDGAPGIFTVRSDGRGPADARCIRTAEDGQRELLTAMPCAIGFEGESYSLVLYGTGWRFGSGIRVRFRFVNREGEFDEVEVVPALAGEYEGENGERYLGLDMIRVTLADDLAEATEVETQVLLSSNNQSFVSQEEVTTEFLGIEEDMNLLNAASFEGGRIARGSIAVAFTQNDEDEEDIFTEETLEAPAHEPRLELGGVRVRVGGRDARILSVAPDEIRFVVPSEVEPSGGVLVMVSNGAKVFNARVTIADVAPGFFTESDDGRGQIVARCGRVLGNGAVEYTAPPCATSSGGVQRTLVLKGTGWRFASGVRLTFDNVELIPSYAGPEPGLPGVDRIEVVLGDEVAGREHDLILSAASNGETFTSQTGAKISFEALPPGEETGEEVRAVKGRRSAQRTESRSTSRPPR